MFEMLYTVAAWEGKDPTEIEAMEAELQEWVEAHPEEWEWEN